DVAGGGFHERAAPDFAARFADDKSIAFPGSGAKGFVLGVFFVEAEAAAGLMLGAEVDDVGLVGDAFELVKMPRREAVIAAGDDVQEFIDGVSAGAPGCALLVGAEKIAVAVELQADGKADA